MAELLFSQLGAVMLGYFWYSDAASPDAMDGSAAVDLPEERVAGQLITPKDRPWNLELLGSIFHSNDPTNYDITKSNSNCDVIFGTSRKNIGLSLFDAWLSSASQSFPGHVTEIWNIGWYASTSRKTWTWVRPDNQVNSIRIEYDLLSDWGWQRQPLTRMYDPIERTFRVPQEQFIDTETIEVNGALIALSLKWGQTFETYQYLSRAQSFVQIQDDTPLNSILDKWVAPLQLLLEFLTLQYVDVNKVVTRLYKIDPQIQIHYNIHRPSNAKKPSSQNVHPTMMLATRNHLSDRGVDLQTLLQNYFMLISGKNHDLALRFLQKSTQSLAEETIDMSLLNAFRALERYHDVEIGGTAIPKDEHTVRVDSIVKSSPDEYQEWARNQLSGANRKGIIRYSCKMS
ncbi:MAG: hypothetical protein OXI96_09820 [Acidimicrobiaceae bacterium]|nr:hypothetical protein [Acidimicrobiaceae bacterium]